MCTHAKLPDMQLFTPSGEEVCPECHEADRLRREDEWYIQHELIRALTCCFSQEKHHNQGDYP